MLTIVVLLNTWAREIERYVSNAEMKCGGDNKFHDADICSREQSVISSITAKIGEATI